MSVEQIDFLLFGTWFNFEKFPKPAVLHVPVEVMDEAVYCLGLKANWLDSSHTVMHQSLLEEPLLFYLLLPTLLSVIQTAMMSSGSAICAASMMLVSAAMC